MSERSVGPPRRGRVRRQEGAADQARGGIGCKPVSPRSGAAQRRLVAKEETRQAASPSWRQRARQAPRGAIRGAQRQSGRRLLSMVRADPTRIR